MRDRYCDQCPCRELFNRVGVDLNTSSWTLPRYVAGVTERTAVDIVKYRDENGRFHSLAQLIKVVGPMKISFQCCTRARFHILDAVLKVKMEIREQMGARN
jgi:transcriptional accessory protein Tex/SPT6